MPIATLAPWADDVWLALLDRDGSYFGRLAEQGTFQRFNRLMDHEYELDLLTGLFSGPEEARFAREGSGFRLAGASINHPFILNFVEWRQEIAVAGPVVALPRFVRQQSLTTQRNYVALGLEWREIGGGPWAVRGGLGMHFFKSSADVELALALRPAAGETGLAMELRLAVLDAFNNAIFNTLGVPADETPAQFDYRALPFGARLDLEWTAPRVRVEVRSGVSTRSRVLVTFPSTADSSYTRAEDVRFAGVLGEVAIHPRVTLALWGTTARAATQRSSDTPAGEDFDLVEETNGIGARARWASAGTLALELDARLVSRPEIRQVGGDSTVRHADRELFTQAALLRRPAVGWLWRLGLAYMDRRPGVLAPYLKGESVRQIMEGGHRFRSGFEVTAGVRWDLDAIGVNVFDGGHVRMSATW